MQPWRDLCLARTQSESPDHLLFHAFGCGMSCRDEKSQDPRPPSLTKSCHYTNTYPHTRAYCCVLSSERRTRSGGEGFDLRHLHVCSQNVIFSHSHKPRSNHVLCCTPLKLELDIAKNEFRSRETFHVGHYHPLKHQNTNYGNPHKLHHYVATLFATQHAARQACIPVWLVQTTGKHTNTASTFVLT